MLEGYTYDEQLQTSEAQAVYNYKFSGQKDGIINGCNLSYSGNDITISGGWFLCGGRLTRNNGNVVVNVAPVAERNFCTLVYEIDLNLVNTESTFVQGYYKVLKSTTAYPVAEAGNPIEGDKVYQFGLANFLIDNTGITSLTDIRPMFESKFEAIDEEIEALQKKNNITNLTLSASAWSGTAPYSQSKTIAGMTAESYPLVYLADNTNSGLIKDAYGLIGTITTTANTITFYCPEEKPTVDIPVVVKGL